MLRQGGHAQNVQLSHRHISSINCCYCYDYYSPFARGAGNETKPTKKYKEWGDPWWSYEFDDEREKALSDSVSYKIIYLDGTFNGSLLDKKENMKGNFYYIWQQKKESRFISLWRGLFMCISFRGNFHYTHTHELRQCLKTNCECVWRRLSWPSWDKTLISTLYLCFSHHFLLRTCIPTLFTRRR